MLFILSAVGCSICATLLFNLTRRIQSKECGLSESTLANIFRRNTVPSISTLEAICSGFGITLSQFFADGDMVEMTPELKELFDNWVTLTPSQKNAALKMIQELSNK